MKRSRRCYEDIEEPVTREARPGRPRCRGAVSVAGVEYAALLCVALTIVYAVLWFLGVLDGPVWGGDRR